MTLFRPLTERGRCFTEEGLRLRKDVHSVWVLAGQTYITPQLSLHSKNRPFQQSQEAAGNSGANSSPYPNPGRKRGLGGRVEVR